MTSPTIPRDAIGLSERLRTKAAMITLGEKIAFGSETGLMLDAAAQLDSLSVDNVSLRLRLGRLARIVNGLESALDCPPSSVAIFDAIDQLKQDRSALSARVKELEAEAKDKEARYDSLIILTQENFDRATRAEQERDRVQSELDTANDNHRAMAAQLARIWQERDEALERLKPFARDFDMNDCDGRKDDNALEVSIKDLRAARDCVRSLASGPSDPMKENSRG